MSEKSRHLLEKLRVTDKIVEKSSMLLARKENNGDLHFTTTFFAGLDINVNHEREFLSKGQKKCEHCEKSKRYVVSIQASNKICYFCSLFCLQSYVNGYNKFIWKSIYQNTYQRNDCCFECKTKVNTEFVIALMKKFCTKDCIKKYLESKTLLKCRLCPKTIRFVDFGKYTFYRYKKYFQLCGVECQNRFRECQLCYLCTTRLNPQKMFAAVISNCLRHFCTETCYRKFRTFNEKTNTEKRHCAICQENDIREIYIDAEMKFMRIYFCSRICFFVFFQLTSISDFKTLKPYIVCFYCRKIFLRNWNILSIFNTRGNCFDFCSENCKFGFLSTESKKPLEPCDNCSSNKHYYDFLYFHGENKELRKYCSVKCHLMKEDPQNELLVSNVGSDKRISDTQSKDMYRKYMQTIVNTLEPDRIVAAEAAVDQTTGTNSASAISNVNVPQEISASPASLTQVQQSQMKPKIKRQKLSETSATATLTDSKVKTQTLPPEVRQQVIDLDAARIAAIDQSNVMPPMELLARLQSQLKPLSLTFPPNSSNEPSNEPNNPVNMQSTVQSEHRSQFQSQQSVQQQQQQQFFNDPVFKKPSATIQHHQLAVKHHDRENAINPFQVPQQSNSNRTDNPFAPSATTARISTGNAMPSLPMQTFSSAPTTVPNALTSIQAEVIELSQKFAQLHSKYVTVKMRHEKIVNVWTQLKKELEQCELSASQHAEHMRAAFDSRKEHELTQKHLYDRSGLWYDRTRDIVLTEKIALEQQMLKTEMQMKETKSSYKEKLKGVEAALQSISLQEKLVVKEIQHVSVKLQKRKLQLSVNINNFKSPAQQHNMFPQNSQFAQHRPPTYHKASAPAASTTATATVTASLQPEHQRRLQSKPHEPSPLSFNNCTAISDTVSPLKYQMPLVTSQLRSPVIRSGVKLPQQAPVPQHFLLPPPPPPQPLPPPAQAFSSLPPVQSQSQSQPLHSHHLEQLMQLSGQQWSPISSSASTGTMPNFFSSQQQTDKRQLLKKPQQLRPQSQLQTAMMMTTTTTTMSMTATKTTATSTTTTTPTTTTTNKRFSAVAPLPQTNKNRNQVPFNNQLIRKKNAALLLKRLAQKVKNQTVQTEEDLIFAMDRDATTNTNGVDVEIQNAPDSFENRQTQFNSIVPVSSEAVCQTEDDEDDTKVIYVPILGPVIIPVPAPIDSTPQLIQLPFPIPLPIPIVANSNNSFEPLTAAATGETAVVTAELPNDQLQCKVLADKTVLPLQINGLNFTTGTTTSVAIAEEESQNDDKTSNLLRAKNCLPIANKRNSQQTYCR